ncbi:metallophosphoesterase [bacterium]|nr:metallophosphoesterase [bacterium]
MRKFLSLFLTSLVLMASAQAKDLRFVQISDARFLSSAENDGLKKVINDVNKQKRVEFAVFTGDNIDKPSQEELKAFLKEAKKLNCPFYIVIGDRDVNKLKSMSKVEYTKILRKQIKKYKPEKPNYTFEKNGVIFIVADGAKDVIPGTNGYYKEDVLAWLDTELAKYPENNVIILQHFPIIPPAEKESYYTFKPENYLKVLAGHKNVKAIISGHFGVNNQKNFNGVEHISTAGVPYYRIIDVMDSETTNPTIWAQLKKAE